MALTIRSVFCFVCSTRDCVVAHSAYRIPVCASSSAAHAPATSSARASILAASSRRFSWGNFREIPARSTSSKSSTLTPSTLWLLFQLSRFPRFTGLALPLGISSDDRPLAPDAFEFKRDSDGFLSLFPSDDGVSSRFDGASRRARNAALEAAATVAVVVASPPLGYGLRPNDGSVRMSPMESFERFSAAPRESGVGVDMA
mmetsp:Transcript_8118/g.29648  ORF Transcript_8118/g.29648 Transcript_8118/m.29648 type:complete len:201 (+) Transcript_8118:2135-2737(+)